MRVTGWGPHGLHRVPPKKGRLPRQCVACPSAAAHTSPSTRAFVPRPAPIQYLLNSDYRISAGTQFGWLLGATTSDSEYRALMSAWQASVARPEQFHCPITCATRLAPRGSAQKPTGASRRSLRPDREVERHEG